MPFFNRKKRDLQALPFIHPRECQWGLGTSYVEGSPLMVRYNESARDLLGHNDLPVKLGFAIPLVAPDENGLPTPEENKQLGKIEDIIVDHVASKSGGILALAIAAEGVKEFVFYIQEGVDVPSIHQTIRSAVTTHDVQCMAVLERDWHSYKLFMPD